MRGEFYTTNCCGIEEFYGMNDSTSNPEAVLADIVYTFLQCPDTDSLESPKRMGHVCGHILLSVARGKMNSVRGGTVPIFPVNHLPKVVKLIRSRRLGSVRVTGWAYNPNSGNEVQAALFTPNVQRCKEWASRSTEVFRLAQYQEQRGERDRWF